MADIEMDQQIADLEKKLRQLELRGQHIQKLLNSDGPAKDNKKKDKKPQDNTDGARSRQQPPKQVKGAAISKGYVYDADAVTARYKHDTDLPKTLVDPSTKYINSLTNTEADVENAYNQNEQNMRKLVRQLGLTTSIFFRAPVDYYEWSVLKRRDLLGASSVHYLCKSMLMHNSKCAHQNFHNPIDSKYYCCVVQYSARLHNDKVGHAIRRLHPDPKPGQKSFNFRWVDGETNDRLTGQPRNGVTPLGAKENVPVIISHKIAELPYGYLWLGGGEIDLKWRISIAEFIKFFNCIVDDITYDEEVETDQGPCGKKLEDKAE